MALRNREDFLNSDKFHIAIFFIPEWEKKRIIGRGLCVSDSVTRNEGVDGRIVSLYYRAITYPLASSLEMDTRFSHNGSSLGIPTTTSEWVPVSSLGTFPLIPRLMIRKDFWDVEQTNAVIPSSTPSTPIVVPHANFLNSWFSV